MAAVSNTPCILDVNLRAPYFDRDLIRESMRFASVLKLSDDEFAEVVEACDLSSEQETETALQAIREQFDLAAIVMTCGSRGAWLISAADVIRQPGVPAEVVDTVGAGDAFTAAFVLGMLRGEPLASVLKVACERGAEVCHQPGAMPCHGSMPIRPSSSEINP